MNVTYTYVETFQGLGSQAVTTTGLDFVVVGI